MSFEQNESFFITQEEENTRLDVILKNRFIGVKSRNYFQNLIDGGLVLLNGLPAKKRFLPKLNDEIEVNFMITREIGIEPENIALDIVYEDNDIIIVNKPAGMVVHPGPGHWTGTFVNALLFHCKDLIKENEPLNSKETYPRPGIVHRLDKDTTGLLIAAKTSLAHERLTAMFSSQKIVKEYTAICIGSPGNREIKNKIGRHPVLRKQMAVVEEGGKESFSVCKTLQYNERYSLVNVELKTGRTHQIRVHLKHVGAPILGCPVYGNLQVNKKVKAARQMLHASFLSFNHPITNSPLEFKLDLPSDMKGFIETLIA